MRAYTSFVADTDTSQRRRVRRVVRTVRDVDAWSVAKVGAVFHLALWLVVMVTGLLLWNVASATGTIDNIENFLESFGWESFTFDGSQLFRSSAILGLFLAGLGTALWVVGAIVFNLITELVGGIRVTVLEEEVVARPTEPTAPGTTPTA